MDARPLDRACHVFAHRATISKALGNLTYKDLQTGEVPFPNSSALDWIGTISRIISGYSEPVLPGPLAVR
jgi:hypothetical protein